LKLGPQKIKSVELNEKIPINTSTTLVEVLGYFILFYFILFLKSYYNGCSPNIESH